MKVEFRSPRQRTLAVPAYWDGGRAHGGPHRAHRGRPVGYLVTTNVPDLDGKTGSFTAAASDSPGFIHPANMHHWAYSERGANGLYMAHLWMGASEPLFATMDDAAFTAMADARAAQKFNHLRGFVISEAAATGAYAGTRVARRGLLPATRQRGALLEPQGIIADLVLAAGPSIPAPDFPDRRRRRRSRPYVVGRYDAMDVTWQR